MFTGRWANELSSTWRSPLDDTYPTVAEALSAHGYATAGFVANLHYTSRELGLARGFAHFEDYPVSLGQLVHCSALVRTVATNFRLRRFLRNDELLSRVSADEINQRFLAWLAARDSTRPFFVFLNYFDAHLPYLPPPPFDRQFGPPPSGKVSLLGRWIIHPRRHQPSAQDIAAGMAAYDGALAYVDSRIGALLDQLDRQGLLDKTVIVITADHGEEFGEHGVFGHGDSLYLASVHVPLVIAYPPRVAARRIAEPVTLRDLAATVVDLTDVSVTPAFPGRSLAQLWAAPARGANAPEPVLSELRRPTGVLPAVPVAKGDMTSLTGTGRRYIRNGDGVEELYDVDHDYWESRNLAGLESGREELTEFRGLLGRLVSPNTAHAGR
jgi:arylsulfatase A-like enzyme